MLRVAGFVIACGLAALAPLAPRAAGPQSDAAPFPGWPARFEGALLEPLALSEREVRFTDGFPGRVGRFTDGSREVVVRWVAEETRMLHPAADCYEGLGYAIRPLPVTIRDGVAWGQFEASKGDERLVVRERIYDESGRAWTDVSAWYWDALLGRSPGPWWSVTTVATARGTV